MTSLASRQSISQLTSASDVLSRLTIDSGNKEITSSNKSNYRFVSANGNGTTTFTNAIPLRSPCCYNLACKYVSLSSNGAVAVIVQFFQVNLVAGVLSQASVASFVSQSVLGNALTVAKNPSANTIDFTVTSTLGGTVTYTLEIEVQNSSAF